MESVYSFAFFVPFMMATFALVFLAVSRAGVPAAASWGCAFLLAALCFVVPLLPVDLVVGVLVMDALLYASFYFFGQALLEHFNVRRYTAVRLGFALLSFGVSTCMMLFADSLQGKLLVGNLSSAILLGFPLLLVIRRARPVIEKVLVLVTGLLVADTFIRIVVFTFFEEARHLDLSFEKSSYAFVTQVSAAVFTLCLALSALGAIIVDTLGRYRDAADRDPMTGLLNRRGFETAVAESLQSKARGAVLMADIDHFKQVNDVFGHSSGDRVIQHLGSLLRDHMPTHAIAARFGGEEFVVYIPGTDVADGVTLAQAVRVQFALADHSEHGITRSVTASFGVAMLRPGEEALHPAISRADEALYASKQAGRNRVTTDAAAAGEEQVGVVRSWKNDRASSSGRL